MYINAVANKYVIALTNSLQNKIVNNEIVNKVEHFVAFIKENQKLYDFIGCKFVLFDEKHYIVCEICDFLTIDGFLKEFLLLIIKNNRLSLIHDIINSLKMQCLNNTNTKIATITTSINFKLTTSLKTHIVKLLERKMNCTILIEERVSHNLVGGVLVECNNLLLDLSIDKLMKIISLELKNAKLQLI